MQTSFRIFLCRLAFFLFALLPTCLVAAWAVQRSQPKYANAQQEDWERFLAQRLGLQVKLAQLSYPSYWVARLDGLELNDPESHQPLLVSRSLEASRTKTAWLVDASQPDLHLDRIEELARILDQRLLRELPADSLPCEFTAHELTLLFGDQAQTVTNVSVVVQSTALGAEAVAQFHVAGNEANAPCRLLVRRVHDGAAGVSTSWELASESVALPCSLIASWVPALKSLGSTAQFVGIAQGKVAEQYVTVELKGRLLQVDLDALITPHSMHRLSGLAEVTIDSLKLQNGRISELRGSVDCRGGYVSDTLLTSAQEHGHFGADATLPLVQDGLVAYRRLAARFQASPEGVTIEGIADPTRAGVVLSSATQSLLLDPTRQPIPSPALIRILVPKMEFQVPATKETLPLLQALPPSSVREGTLGSANLKVRVRLQD